MVRTWDRPACKIGAISLTYDTHTPPPDPQLSRVLIGAGSLPKFHPCLKDMVAMRLSCESGSPRFESHFCHQLPRWWP